ALQGYAIRGPLGAGVWGTVSEAVDPRGRRVALKELRPTLVADPEARRRFGAVASMLESIDHPHVVRMIEHFDDDGRCVLVSELVRSETPTPASDVYAMATMLYELLAGRLPFPDEGDGLTTMARHVQEQPVDLVTVAPGVAPSVAGVTMRGLAAAAGDRYASADEFGAALADAAATAWGAGWLRQTGMTVTASEVVTERLRATRALEVPVVAETLAPPAAAAPAPTPAADLGATMAAPAVAPAPPPASVAAPPAAAPSPRRTGGATAIA